MSCSLFFHFSPHFLVLWQMVIQLSSVHKTLFQNSDSSLLFLANSNLAFRFLLLLRDLHLAVWPL
uniref:Uncharacterized protein n=1 Tax=Anguilla anguilla TaxID=7936 RepID=A0A0E9UGR4_ANGAN